MAARTRESYQTPIPNREIEARASGNGPVITYQLSPEELERYRAMPVDVKRNQNGQRMRKPMDVHSNHSPEEQRKRALERIQKEENDLNTQATVKEEQAAEKFVPNKVEFLKQVATGKSINKVEKEMGMKPSTLFYYVKKWGWGGIKPDRAQQLLDEMAIDGETPNPTGLIALNEQRKEDLTTVIRERDADEFAEMKVRLDRALERISSMTETVNITLAANDALKQECEKHKQFAILLDEKIEKQIEAAGELLDSRAEDLLRYKSVVEEKEEFKLALGAAKLVIEDLEQDRAVLLETIEQSAIGDETPVQKRAGRSIHTELDAPTEQIVDELAALISYIRSGNGKAFYLDLQLVEVTA